MSSERPAKKAKTTNVAEASVGGRSSGGIHLMPELVARVATFADAVDSSDVMNMCLAVGPAVSRTVRHYYLWRNEKFLTTTISKLCQGGISRDKVRCNHLAWMKVNADWRTIAVRDSLMDKLKLACKKCLNRSRTGKIPMRPMIDVVHPFIAFNNPAVAIQIGLFDSLKHLVEDKGIDINSFEWTKFGFGMRLHLLHHASSARNEEIFVYLLNRPGVNIRCVHVFQSLLSLTKESGRFESSFLKIFMKHPQFHINGRIIPRRTYRSSGGHVILTPLYAATETCLTEVRSTCDETRFRAISQALEILLSSGADPNLSFPGYRSPIEYLRRMKSRVRAAAQRGDYPGFSVEDYKASERYWDEAEELLEKYA